MKLIMIIFIYIFLSFTLISSKSILASANDLKIMDQVGVEVGDLKSNLQEIVVEEHKDFLSNPSENFSGGIMEVVKSLSDQFDDYNKNLIEEGNQSPSSTNLDFNKENYLAEIKKVTSSLSETVSSLVDVEKNHEKKEQIEKKLGKLQPLQKKFVEAKEKIKFLRTLKENNNLLKVNADKAKIVMGNLIGLYNEYLSVEDNLNTNLNSNLSEIKKDFQLSNNLISNIDFFTILFEKLENFYFLLEENSSNGEDTAKIEKFKIFTNQTNQLDQLNKNLNSIIENEIQKVKNIPDHQNRLKSLNNLLKMYNVLKSLNVKVLKLKENVCKKMKISLESNIEQVTNLIKNSKGKEAKDSSLFHLKSIVKMSEDRKKAVDIVKSKILTHLNDVQNLIKTNMNHVTEDFKDGKLAVSKTVINNFSEIEAYFKELKNLNVSYDLKQRVKVNSLILTTKSVLNQLEQLILNSKNILNALKKNNENQSSIKAEYNNLVQKLENLKSNLKASDYVDANSITEMNSQIKNYSSIFQSLKTGEFQTAIQKKNLKKLVNTNDSILQNISIGKVVDQIKNLKNLNR